MTPSGPRISVVNANEQLDRLRRDHPDLYDCIDLERAKSWFQSLEKEPAPADDFGYETAGGRGESYLRAQEAIFTARAQGIEQLLGFIRAGDSAERKTVIDVLGGNGLVRQVATASGIRDVTIFTCDISPYMVEAAWTAGHPALLQSAHHLLQKDSSVDGVLVAYGSHHLDSQKRVDVAVESYRVLRPGGVFVLHDFLTDSPMEEWFGQVVDRHSLTGHDFEHFSREDILGYLTKAGFESYEVIEVPDPYVATGATAEGAELALGRYLLDMYGLVEIERTWHEQAERWAIERAKQIFRYPEEDGSVSEFRTGYDEHDRLWRCTLPRKAVVGIGRKLR